MIINHGYLIEVSHPKAGKPYWYANGFIINNLSSAVDTVRGLRFQDPTGTYTIYASDGLGNWNRL